MSRKKVPETVLSQEDNDQVQLLLSEYHQVADALHHSSDQPQAEVALSEVHALSEPAQLALLKALSREHDSDAADLLSAINALSIHKEVRKEARRSLIRLEGSKIYPRWTPPITRTPAVQVSVLNPPRFWKGEATLSREEGSIQLFLFWEQGYDYSEVRLMAFLLEFWEDGVRDVIVETGTRRSMEIRLAEMRTKNPDTIFTDCTLAEAKRLIEEALSVNAWRKIPPKQDFRTHESLINRLILQASELGEDRGSTFINPELEDQEVAINFLGAWSLGDYGLAYDLLANNSSVRDRLSRDEWINLRRNWADEAHPVRMQLGFVRELEQRPSSLWLPSSSRTRSTPNKEVEVGWSLELLETPLSGTLKEMAMGTAVNKETSRHWFWTSYSLVREQNIWRIQQTTDEGARTQGLSIQELQGRIKEFEDAIEERVKKRDSDVEAFMEEMSWRLTQLLHYYDALIARLPLDYTVVEEAYSRSILIGNPEHTLVYLERMTRRFSDDHVENLLRLGSTLAGLAYQYEDPGMNDRKQHLLSRAEETMREAVSRQDSARAHALLGELLLSQSRHDEAEAEFLTARAKTPSPNEEASIEAGLGNIAMRREQIEEASLHYKRVVEIDPSYPGIWFSLGFAHRQLGHMDEAEASYLQALQRDPNDPRLYGELTAIYMNSSQPQKAQELLEKALHTFPESAHLHALFAAVLFEKGDRRGARLELARAEAIDPELDVIQRVRQLLNLSGT